MARKPQKKTDEQFYAEAAREPPLPDSADPLKLFEQWLADARKAEPNDPNGMALATAAADGLPNVLMVLLKGVDQRGFFYYTNPQRAKGGELAANAKAALLFHWKSLRRQVRVQGPVEPVTVEEADALFATRPRGSQIGAWASDQSRAMPDRLALERRVAEYGLKVRSGQGRAPAAPGRVIRCCRSAHRVLARPPSSVLHEFGWPIRVRGSTGRGPSRGFIRKGRWAINQ